MGWNIGETFPLFFQSLNYLVTLCKKLRYHKLQYQLGHMLLTSMSAMIITASNMSTDLW